MRSRNEKRAKKRLSQAPPTPSILVPPTYTTTQCGKPNSFSFFFLPIFLITVAVRRVCGRPRVLCVWGLRVSECAPTEVARWLSYAATLHRECLTFSLLFPPSFVHSLRCFFFLPYAARHGNHHQKNNNLSCLCTH